MLFYLKLLLAVVSAVLSVCWLLQVVLYMFTAPPISPFLNTFFITLCEKCSVLTGWCMLAQW